MGTDSIARVAAKNSANLSLPHLEPTVSAQDAVPAQGIE